MAIKTDGMPQRLVGDAGAAADLRQKFKEDPRAGLKAAAQQFEAMFLQMVMKSMRDATPQDGLFDSDQSRFYTTMLDQQLAQNMATSGKGLGFARLIEEQLGRNLAATGSSGLEALHSAKAAAGNDLVLAALAQRFAATQSKPSAEEGTSSAASSTLAMDGVSAGVSTKAANSDARAFVERIWPHAVEASRATGIPPQFLVAHAALESGWGKHEIRRSDGSSSCNLFGIKAGKQWAGEVVEATTTEYVDGKAQTERARFRAYESYAAAFRDYGALLGGHPRYAAVLGAQDGMEFARRLQQAGYATDPQYAAKLASIINGPALRQALVG